MQPKTEPGKLERNFSKFLDEMEEENDRIRRGMQRHEPLPQEWLDLHKQVPTQPPKCNLTLSLDQNVVDWYRALGRCYQAQMNGVLRAYMLAILPKNIEQPGDRDWPSGRVIGRQPEPSIAGPRYGDPAYELQCFTATMYLGTQS